MTEYRPPDPTAAETRPEGVYVEPGERWSPATIFGGLCILAVTVTVCLLVLHWAGVIG